MKFITLMRGAPSNGAPHFLRYRDVLGFRPSPFQMTREGFAAHGVENRNVLPVS
jgi:hypothetical protein